MINYTITLVEPYPSNDIPNPRLKNVSLDYTGGEEIYDIPEENIGDLYTVTIHENAVGSINFNYAENVTIGAITFLARDTVNAAVKTNLNNLPVTVLNVSVRGLGKESYLAGVNTRAISATGRSANDRVIIYDDSPNTEQFILTNTTLILNGNQPSTTDITTPLSILDSGGLEVWGGSRQ